MGARNLSDQLTVTINNWTKHNPRKDVSKPSWFRLSNRILEDSDLYSLSDSELKAFLYLMSQASQKNTETFSVNLQHALKVCKIRPRTILNTIDKLSAIGIVTADVTPTSRARNADDTSTNATGENKRLQENTRDSATGVGAPAPLNSAAVFEASKTFDYQSLVDRWPKPTAKNEAKKRMAQEFNTPELFEKLKFAVNNCLHFHQIEMTEYKFHPSLIGFLDNFQHWTIKRTPKPPQGAQLAEANRINYLSAEEALKQNEEYGRKLEEEAPKLSEEEIKRGIENLRRMGVKVPDKIGKVN